MIEISEIFNPWIFDESHNIILTCKKCPFVMKTIEKVGGSRIRQTVCNHLKIDVINQEDRLENCPIKQGNFRITSWN